MGGGVTESGTLGLGRRNGGSASVAGGVVDVEVASGSADAPDVEVASDDPVSVPLPPSPPHAVTPIATSRTEPNSTRIPPRVIGIGRLCRPGRFPARATRRAVVPWGQLAGADPVRRYVVVVDEPEMAGWSLAVRTNGSPPAVPSRLVQVVPPSVDACT
jgi:hypothetical protein